MIELVLCKPNKTKPLPTNGRKFKLKCANENNIDDNNAEI